MKTLLQKYVGQEIGININEMDEFHVATLVNIIDYISVLVSEKREVKTKTDNWKNTCRPREKYEIKQIMVHYPYSQLIFVSESNDGFLAKDGKSSSKKVNVIVQVYTLNKGKRDGTGNGIGVGFGMLFPIDTE